MSKTKIFPVEPNLDLRKPWYLRNDLCDMPSTVCWPKHEQIFTRWSSYRSNWIRPGCKNDKDEVALSRRYSVSLGMVNKPPTHEACTATFASFHSLDKCEDKWYHQLDAQINIPNTCFHLHHYQRAGKVVIGRSVFKCVCWG